MSVIHATILRVEKDMDAGLRRRDVAFSKEDI
jgi:hypothetical protein